MVGRDIGGRERVNLQIESLRSVRLGNPRIAALDLQPVRTHDYRTLITAAAREAAATEQGKPITKAVIEALKDRKLLVPMPELLIRLAMAGRAAARRQAWRGLIRDLEQPSMAALDQLLIDRSGDRSHLGWIAEAPEGVGSGWGRNPTLAISSAGSLVAELYDSLSHGFQSALHDHLAFRGNI